MVEAVEAGPGANLFKSIENVVCATCPHARHTLDESGAAAWSDFLDKGDALRDADRNQAGAVTELGFYQAQSRTGGSRNVVAVGRLVGRWLSRVLALSGGTSFVSEGAKFAVNRQDLQLRAKIARLLQMKHGGSTPTSIGLVGFLVATSFGLPISRQIDHNLSKINMNLCKGRLATFPDACVQRTAS